MKNEAREQEIQDWEARMEADCRQSEAHEAMLDEMVGQEDPMSIEALRRRWPNASNTELEAIR